jgi:hypothetical protein
MRLVESITWLVLTSSGCSPPASGNAAAPELPAAEPALAPCPTDQFRQLSCVTLEGEPPACPARLEEATIEADHLDPRLWRPAPDAMTLDEALTARFRAEGEPAACCWSGCVEAPVRPQGRVAHDYVQLKCIPAMRPSAASPDRPDCPAALDFPDDMPDQVAPFDPEGTREVVAGWSSSREPLLPSIAWCCYRSAPAAAIGPE